ncbi:MAG: triose-phosphate isomerase [Candidatus Thorarchaeota archaeon]
MRKPIIGGNWKMNLGTPEESKLMVKKLIPLVKNMRNIDIVIAAPFTVLTTLREVLKKTNIKLGAQNMHYEENGAYTGEISPKFLKDIGIEYVILGHSERRDLFDESDELINQKLKKAISLDLKPIVCIGEHLKEREAGQTKEIIEYQFNETFKELSKQEILKTVIAYEPIWAIGTGKTATPEQAEEIHIYIRELLKLKFDIETADNLRIQYGGSINPNNAKELFNKENIDGGLVGGASLRSDSFFKIIKAAIK